MTRVLPLLLLPALNACVEPAVIDTLELGGTAERSAEVLLPADATGATGRALPIAPYGVLAETKGTPVVDLPNAAQTTRIEGLAGDVIDVARLPQGTLLLSTEVGLVAWDGELRDSPLAELVQSPVRDIAVDGAVVWLLTDEGLLRWSSGELSTVTLDGAAVEGPIFAGGRLNDASVLWAATPELVAMEWREGAAVVVDHTPERTPESLAVDADGRVWAIDDGVLWRRDLDGSWARYESEARALSVVGDAGVDHAVVSYADGTVLEAGARLRTLQGQSQGTVRGLDAAGRIFVTTEAGIERWYSDLTPALDGLESGGALRAARTLYLSLSQRDQVDKVTATLDGAEIPVLSEPWRLQLDPVELSDGTHTLEVAAAYLNDATATMEVPFDVFSITSTWSEHVEPIYDASCAGCHGAAQSPNLSTPEAWESHIGRIIERVDAGEMPPGTNNLTPDEVNLIRAWRAGGFPR